ncbi:MAG TPA: TolC family protein [Gemmatimonadaceae bacterium]|jgi:cobalt-zinc-cadmium efflux system outer membrane protein|nr:TolC family protein [Gemmatimonadaceae bacterium]
MRFFTLAAVLACLPSALLAQTPVTRAQAVESAVSRGPRAALARADTLVGAAQLLAARQLENPSLGLTYSKSVPRYHEILDLPIDIFGVRSARIGSAEAARLAGRYRFAFEQAAAALDADTTYTRALASREHLRLSQRNARDADSLRRMAILRRDAGDASELDVLLANVNAGQAENQAAADSLAYVSSLFDLQTIMGFDSAKVTVAPVDSLTLPSSIQDSLIVTDLPIAAAEQALSAADLALRATRRGIFTPLSVQAGVEHGDPSEPGVLPTFGISIPLPLLNRNRGAIAQATAERERAAAELALVRLETRAAIGRATRARALALERIRRDRLLLENADRIAAMSLTAYREGAEGLPAVLEAQRNAREIVSHYIDDVAAAWIAIATLRLYNLAPGMR